MVAFKIPKASHASLKAVKAYMGDRWEHISDVMDTDSEWFLKYCDIVARGLVKRKIPYAEAHHILPFVWFTRHGSKDSERYSEKTLNNNVTCLTVSEHIVAHYCAFMCTRKSYSGSLARAFTTMANVKGHGKHVLIPGEEELLAMITELEILRIKKMQPHVSKVDAEGRTHSWEDMKQYKKDYYNSRKTTVEFKEWQKEYKARKRDSILEWHKDYYHKQVSTPEGREAVRVDRRVSSKKYREKNKDNPEFIEHRRKLQRESRAVRMADPEYRKRENEKRRIHNSLPEQKAKQKAKRENNMQDPEYRAKKNAAGKKCYDTMMKDPVRRANYREKKKEARRKRMADPEYRARVNSRQREWEKRKKDEGYRKRKDPVTGKSVRMFVGKNPEPCRKYATKEEARMAKKIRDKIKYELDMQDPAKRQARNEKGRKWRDENREKAREIQRRSKRKEYEKMTAAGYRYLKDKESGRRKWIFVGVPEKEAAA